ncbi:hypothetical protein G6F61_009438 [Rhizopus arrhizus]|nr:hypothetical protein G6F61_009438 [Rhizopus arrhizus]
MEICQDTTSLRQELSETYALKANVCWQEAGEKSVKYLKNLYRQRTVEQHITTLRPNDSTEPVESIDWVLPIAQQFYQSLSATEPVDGHQVEHYLADIQGSPQLTDDHTDHLLEPMTVDEIIHETVRVENKQKSNLTSLKNWRSISLINCDAKIYTRIINSRMRQVISSTINRCQTGFMTNSFIAENGLVLNMVMEHARQCDPLSPLLFNLALEPFLQQITQGNSFLGFSFAPLSSNIPLTPALKILAYADDVCDFLSSPEDFVRVQYRLHIYSQVSNAKVNLSKTEAIFLNGCASPSWQQMLLQHQVVKWHDHTKPQPLRYLGFPVIQSIAQRRYVEEHLLQSVKTQCGLYSQRQLSIRGRVILANTLILSKLCYDNYSKMTIQSPAVKCT